MQRYIRSVEAQLNATPQQQQQQHLSTVTTQVEIFIYLEELYNMEAPTSGLHDGKKRLSF